MPGDQSYCWSQVLGLRLWRMVAVSHEVFRRDDSGRKEQVRVASEVKGHGRFRHKGPLFVKLLGTIGDTTRKIMEEDGLE